MLDENGKIRKNRTVCTAIGRQGSPYIMSAWLDITERKQTEQALRRSEAQFKALFQNLHSAVALIDEQGKFSIVNPSFPRMFDLVENTEINNVNDSDWSQWLVFDKLGGLLEVDEHPVGKAVMTGSAVRDKLVNIACVPWPWSMKKSTSQPIWPW